MITLVELLIFTGCFFTLIVAVKIKQIKRKSGRLYPPSLPCLPILGSLPFIRDFDKLPIFFKKKADEVGPIFTLRFGNRRVVVLNNFESIEDALVRHGSSFSGKESFYVERYLCNRNQKGIAFVNYNAGYKKFKKLTISVLRDFGFRSTSSMESRILIEVAELVDHFKKTNGKPFDPHDLIMLSVSNVFYNIAFGRRRSYEAGKSEMISQLERFSRAMDPALEFFQILRFFPPYSRKFAEVADSHAKLIQAIEKEAQKSLKEENMDCFINRYIQKEGPAYDHEQLIYTLRDLTGGSTETLTATLLWVFVYLANHPRVAERIQMEIDSVVSRDRLPALDDQPKLPYTEATLLEILRHRTALPLAIPHLTLHDTEVLGYFIPANTIVIPNLQAANMNAKVWQEPDAFKPERFLNEKNEVINSNRVISFSLGRRSCPGEQLARQQLFLCVSGLVQNFFIRPPDDTQLIDVKAIFGITEAPSRYELRMIRRD